MSSKNLFIVENPKNVLYGTLTADAKLALKNSSKYTN